MTQNVKTHVFQVNMKCGNCLKKLKNALDPLKGKGIEEYELLFEDQKVEVKGTLPAEEILNVIKSTGKEGATLISSS